MESSPQFCKVNRRRDPQRNHIGGETQHLNGFIVKP
ncbi:hypothetical protein C1703_33870 [Streptomyces sp. Go-475]|nr:hypothetical protein C1703_33870 [Streptomyces sp. Go-475]